MRGLMNSGHFIYIFSAYSFGVLGLMGLSYYIFLKTQKTKKFLRHWLAYESNSKKEV